MIIQGDQTKHNCPRCKDEPLRVEVIEGRPLERCMRCEGMWVDRETLEKIYKDGDQNSAIKSISTTQPMLATQAKPLDGSKRSKNQINTQGYIRCPMCNTIMNRQNFGRYSGVVVDICREHGTWFDADELNRIMTFISNGGLQKAALKEKRALEEEVRRLESKRFLGHGDAVWAENIEFQGDKNVIGGSMVAIAWNLLKRLL
jgi:Zn-finger nucleic acid-binding protein